MKQVEIEYIAKFLRNGKAVKQQDDAGGLPISRIETIADGNINPRKVGFAGLSEIGNDEWLLENGDILISHINSTKHLGKCAFYEGSPEKLIHGMNLLNLRCDTDKADPRYVFYVLNSSYFKKQIPNITNNSVNQSSFTVTKLKKLRIPLPPLPEQRRIAAVLDKADAIRRKRAETIKLLDQFLRSVFLEMFGDPVRNERGWNRAPIKQIATVTTGNTPSRKILEYYGDYIEWIKSDNINTPSYTLTKATEFLSEKGVKLARTVPAGSTLITCIAGSPSCVGNAAFTDREVAFNQQINALIPDKKTNPLFLYSLVNYSKKIIQSGSTNSMKGMVSKGVLENLLLIVPPQELQNKYADIFRVTQNNLKEHSAHLLDFNALFFSLTQYAFRGEL